MLVRREALAFLSGTDDAGGGIPDAIPDMILKDPPDCRDDDCDECAVENDFVGRELFLAFAPPRVPPPPPLADCL
jgi:hypothetical protein